MGFTKFQTQWSAIDQQARPVRIGRVPNFTGDSHWAGDDSRFCNRRLPSDCHLAAPGAYQVPNLLILTQQNLCSMIRIQLPLTNSFHQSIDSILWQSGEDATIQFSAQDRFQRMGNTGLFSLGTFS